ncbi:MAG: hypothetical protein WBV06_18795 [Acidimicrobiia bacterium]
MTLPVVAGAVVVLVGLLEALPSPQVRRLRWLLPVIFGVGAIVETGTWQRVSLTAIGLIALVAVILSPRWRT